LVLKCLQRSEGNRTQAAEWMAVSIRTLRNKLARFKEEQREEFSAYY
jgi:DNA-binding protein Fis